MKDEWHWRNARFQSSVILSEYNEPKDLPTLLSPGPIPRRAFYCMKTHHSTAPAQSPNRPRHWSRLLLLAFILHSSSFILSSCSRPPQTAAELQQRLPAQYQGELHLQGEADAHRLVLEAHDLKERDPHLLEFGKVRYQFFTGPNLTTGGEASIRGTISTPDLTINVESFSGEEGGDVLKPGTFQGKFSKDLKTIEANWTTGFGQKITLKAKAQP